MGECGGPALLYPESPEDAAALLAGPGTPGFWASSMVLRCPAHAPATPASHLKRGDGPMTCEWPDGGPPPASDVTERDRGA